MNRVKHVQLMASYNEWMNSNLYEAAMKLPDEELVRNQKAFFGSILGTLNHLVVADTFWLKRFANHPANYLALEPVIQLPTPTALDQILFHDIRSLSSHRKMLDGIMIQWTNSITEDHLDHVLHYSSTKGLPVVFHPILTQGFHPKLTHPVVLQYS